MDAERGVQGEAARGSDQSIGSELPLAHGSDRSFHDSVTRCCRLRIGSDLKKIRMLTSMLRTRSLAAAPALRSQLPRALASAAGKPLPSGARLRCSPEHFTTALAWRR